MGVFKVIIAGGRDFNDYDLLRDKCNNLLQHSYNIQIISGCAKGADTLGEKYAIERGYSIKKFPADWDQFGKRAGFIRNKQMAEYADALILFWDGKSAGSKLMKKLAEENNLKIRIISIW